MTSNFKTNDWQWFLQDIETQLESQMRPDQNEVEKYQVEQREKRSGSTPSHSASAARGSGAQVSPDKSSESNRKLLPSPRSSSGGAGGYGTFFDVRKTGTLNGRDDDGEEMPVLPPSKRAR